MHTRTLGVSGLAREWGVGKGEPGMAPKSRIKEAAAGKSFVVRTREREMGVYVIQPIKNNSV